MFIGLKPSQVIYMKKIWFMGIYLLVLIFSAGMFAGCAGEAAEDTGEQKIGVVVSILPQAEFAERVGGDRVMVTVMIPPGGNPHTYELTPRQLEEVSRAKIYAKVGSGIEFELVWTDKIISVNSEMLVVDCSRGIDLIESADNSEHEDENGELNEEEFTGERTYHNYNPHVWLSPANAKIMVENIYSGLIEVDPDGRNSYYENKVDFQNELDELDNEIRKILSGKKNRKILVYHPAWTYFARDYHLEQIIIEKEGKEPTAEGIRNLISQAKLYNIKLIFASPELSVKSAETIAREIGGSVVLISPLEKDYLANMRKAAEAFGQALE